MKNVREQKSRRKPATNFAANRFAARKRLAAKQSPRPIPIFSCSVPKNKENVFSNECECDKILSAFQQFKKDCEENNRKLAAENEQMKEQLKNFGELVIAQNNAMNIKLDLIKLGLEASSTSDDIHKMNTNSAVDTLLSVLGARSLALQNIDGGNAESNGKEDDETRKQSQSRSHRHNRSTYYRCRYCDERFKRRKYLEEHEHDRHGSRRDRSRSRRSRYSDSSDE